MFTILFYGMAIGAIAFQLYQLLNPSTVIYLESAISFIGKKEKTHEDYIDSLTDLYKWSKINLIFLCWSICGIFTSYWLGFVILIIFSLMNRVKKSIIVLTSLTSIAFLLFVILNKFYLHLF